MSHIRYDYTGDSRLLEGADWIGCRLGGLELHYHEEVQVSLVWSGEREYRIGDRRLRLRPGQVLVIPPLCAHHALPSLANNVRSTEFYLTPSMPRLYHCGYLLLEWPDLAATPPSEAATVLAERLGEIREAAIVHAGPDASPRGKERLTRAIAEHDDLAGAARYLGLSREGFIRAFSRGFGLTPHAYKLNSRLNEARQFLRDGFAIADVAYATGFSDQSHLGRMFLRFFGTTPGQFRAAHSGG